MNSNHPILLNADNIRDDVQAQVTYTDKEGLTHTKWVRARPIGAPTMLERLKLSWGVFCGKYDALEWTGQ